MRMEILEMPEKSTVYFASGFDLQIWSEKSNYEVIKQTDNNRKITVSNFDTIYAVMD